MGREWEGPGGDDRGARGGGRVALPLGEDGLLEVLEVTTTWTADENEVSTASGSEWIGSGHNNA